MEDFIYLKENSLSREICEDIIFYYNRDKKLGYKGVTASGENINIKDTWDLQITKLIQEDETWANIHKLLYTELYTNLKKYLDILSIKKEYNKYHSSDYPPFKIITQNPLKTEIFQMQKYEKGKGKYIYHNDSKIDIKSNQYRVVTFLWYLNDVNEGGETELFGNIKIKPEAGKLLLFPATWTFPHCGTVPISNDKYIITGWIHADI